MHTETLSAVFTGDGGYPKEREDASKIFVVDRVYEVERGWMGQSHSTIKIKGIDGQWNSVLFDVNLNHPCIESTYMGTPKYGRRYPLATYRELDEI